MLTIKGKIYLGPDSTVYYFFDPDRPVRGVLDIKETNPITFCETYTRWIVVMWDGTSYELVRNIPPCNILTYLTTEGIIV